MLRGEPGEWAEMKKKLNHLLEKLTPDSVVPVEVFDPQTLLKKSGQLEVKENGKVVPKQCFLFSRHFAVATVEKLPNQLLSYRIDNVSVLLHGKYLCCRVMSCDSMSCYATLLARLFIQSCYRCD